MVRIGSNIYVNKAFRALGITEETTDDTDIIYQDIEGNYLENKVAAQLTYDWLIETEHGNSAQVAAEVATEIAEEFDLGKNAVRAGVYAEFDALLDRKVDGYFRGSYRKRFDIVAEKMDIPDSEKFLINKYNKILRGEEPGYSIELAGGAYQFADDFELGVWRKLKAGWIKTRREKQVVKLTFEDYLGGQTGLSRVESIMKGVELINPWVKNWDVDSISVGNFSTEGLVDKIEEKFGFGEKMLKKAKTKLYSILIGAEVGLFPTEIGTEAYDAIKSVGEDALAERRGGVKLCKLLLKQDYGLSHSEILKKVEEIAYGHLGGKAHLQARALRYIDGVKQGELPLRKAGKKFARDIKNTIDLNLE